MELSKAQQLLFDLRNHMFDYSCNFSSSDINHIIDSHDDCLERAYLHLITGLKDLIKMIDLNANFENKKLNDAKLKLSLRVGYTSDDYIQKVLSSDRNLIRSAYKFIGKTLQKIHDILGIHEFNEDGILICD